MGDGTTSEFTNGEMEAVGVAAAMDEGSDDEPDMEHTMRVLEERELTEHDIGEIHDTRVGAAAALMLFEQMIGGDESMLVVHPHCTSFGDCLLRRAASLGRMESAALLISLGARIDFPPTVLERWGCLGTPLVNACVM